MYNDFINEISKTIDINNIFTNKEVNKYIIEYIYIYGKFRSFAK